MPDFTTREMLQAIENRMPIGSFFASFFPTMHTHVAEVLQLEVKKGKRVMAPFVSPREGGKVMKRKGYSSRLLQTPKIAPERPMTIDDISKKMLGENVYSTKSPEERADELIAKDMTDLEEAIQRRKEWMAREIVLTGEINVEDPEDGVDVQIDFGFTNKTTLSGTALWSHADSNPIEDLGVWRKAVIKATGKAPTVCIMAGNVYQAFKNHPKVQKELNILNMSTGKIEPRVVDQSLTFLGRLTELDLDIYAYDEWFIDDDGIEQPMLPEGKLLLLPQQVGSFEYGGVTQLDDGEFVTYQAEMVPKIMVDEKNNMKTLRLTSRPLPKPDDVDSWYVATVL
ncbi:MAG: major capsid protein [Cellulosilyticaceae bacterium]